MILSASRRTDIPALYSPWFLQRLREGEVMVRNPRNPRQVSRVRLSPEWVDAIVFWTKDPLPLLPFLPELDRMGYAYDFQFTVTPYGRDLEPGLREKSEIAKTFRRLSQTVGRERMVWRYDPIVLDDMHPPRWHREAFSRLCAALAEAADACVLSFFDRYLGKNRLDAGLREPSPAQMEEIAADFSRIAGEWGLPLTACAEAGDFSAFGIQPASCISRERLERICGCPLSVRPAAGQRSLCRCVESVDVGAYHTCTNGCVYCYANQSPGRAEKNRERHDPNSPLLIGRLSPEDRVTEKTGKSQKQAGGQLRFF